MYLAIYMFYSTLYTDAHIMGMAYHWYVYDIVLLIVTCKAWTHAHILRLLYATLSILTVQKTIIDTYLVLGTIVYLYNTYTPHRA